MFTFCKYANHSRKNDKDTRTKTKKQAVKITQRQFTLIFPYKISVFLVLVTDFLQFWSELNEKNTEIL